MQDCVLIAEDSPDIREALAELLVAAGYKVLLAANGEVALQYLQNGARPFAILLDLMMPVMDGMTFRREQRRHPDMASIPVILLSADRGIAEKAAELEVATYLKKPASSEEIIAALECARAH